MTFASAGYLSGRFLFALDRAADKLVQEHVGISYKRVLFLIVLQHSGTVTQHELARALGYSDPAVSTMLTELVKEGYIHREPSPTHGRKRLVSITAHGTTVVAQARQVLDEHFDQLLIVAGVDADAYRALIGRLYDALIAKLEMEDAS